LLQLSTAAISFTSASVPMSGAMRARGRCGR
jgi:hypothetical protein